MAIRPKPNEKVKNLTLSPNNITTPPGTAEMRRCLFLIQ